MKTTELKAEFDCITGNRKHFTIENTSAAISGGLYIKKGVEVPDQIIISFKKEKKKDSNN